MTPQDDREIERLTQAYLDEALSDEEAGRLHELFKADPSRLDAFIRTVDLHGVLSGLRIDRAEPQQTPARRPATRHLLHRPLQSGGRPAWVAALAAAGILIAVGLFAIPNRTPPENGRGPEARTRRERLQAEHARAEEGRRQAENRLREIERRREVLTRPQTLPAPDLAAEEERKKDLATLDSEKERVEREMQQAIDQARKARLELAQIPEKQPEPPTVSEPVAPGVKPGTQTIVARLENTEGGVFITRGTERMPARAGLEIGAGQGLDVAGRASLRYPDGTHVELEPGTVLRALTSEGGKRFFVEKGAVRAVVAKQPPGQPMVLSTPHGKGQVIGTTFKLLVEPGDRGSTHLEVEEGKVQLTRMSDGKTVDVASGQYAVAAVGVELSAKPVTIDEIVLLTRLAKIVGNEWVRITDPDAAGGTALESRERTPDDAKARIRSRTLGYLEFTFAADARKDYRVWVRGRCPALQQPTAHDFLVVAPVTEATFTGLSTPEERAYWEGNSRDISLMAGHLNGWGLRQGYFWVGGNTDPLGVFQETEFAPVQIRFSHPGKQTLRVYGYEGPMRIDVVWLSATRKSRPTDSQTGPVPGTR